MALLPRQCSRVHFFKKSTMSWTMPINDQTITLNTFYTISSVSNQENFHWAVPIHKQ